MDRERDYDFTAVETRWQKEWVATNPWAAPVVPTGNKRYMLTMFPYPSGDLHMGHIEVFSIHDALSRYSRMQGFEVLNPIGWDAFGLPAENAAIKRGVHPKPWTYENVAKHRASMERLGLSFDWDRVVLTCEPTYYRWNQWLFLQLYERGLAYRKAAAANWCPKDKTVLANEQVIAGRCERCDTPVVKKWLTQWFFKITDYADRLLDDMDLLSGWTERLQSLQRNWIGRSYGAEVNFKIEGRLEPVRVYTTRPDTLWGATFFVVAPEHPLADELVAGGDKEEELSRFREEVGRLSEIDRTSTEREKKGMFTGKHVINPVTGEAIPIWLADYVLMDYGTGAIMAVPAHDQRDFEFARSYGLEIKVVIEPEGESLDSDTMAEAYSGAGVMVNSGEFDGTSTEISVERVTTWLEQQNLGAAAKNFRIRDWLVSRQRYWGTPIPIIFCDACGEVPVPYDQLPVILPDEVSFEAQEGSSPLASATDWVNVPCPNCSAPARRETDTLDTFVDSSWYYHRYLDPRNEVQAFDPAKDAAWMPIDLYSGGVEHAVLHLIYTRFIQKVLLDMGLVKDPEPFPAMLNQGTITMGGKRMSKSRGNIVEPVEAFEKYGADALRLYLLFSGPPEAAFDWPEEGVRSIGRVSAPWLQRVWRLCEDVAELPVAPEGATRGPEEVALRKLVHQTIKVVTRDFENVSLNTIIARLQEMVNGAYRYLAAGGSNRAVLLELVERLLLLLAPLAPYLTEEEWRRLGHDGSVHDERWPEYDPLLAAEEEVTLVVQVNGKVRDTILVPVDVSEDEMLRRALDSKNVQVHLGGKEPSKVIARPPRLISLVVPK
jgi:leucyl-tRNA synthetase